MSGEEEERPNTVSLPGVFLRAQIQVQCLRCAENDRIQLLTIEVSNEAPEDLDGVDDYTVACPQCTADLGMEAVIPVSILAGEQVEKLFNGDEGDEATP